MRERKRRALKRFMVFALLLIVSAGVAGCGTPKPTEPAAQDGVSYEERGRLATKAPRPALVFGACIDTTTSLPIEFALTIKDRIAAQLAASVRGPQGALKVFVRAINSKPYEPSAEVFSTTVPEVPQVAELEDEENIFDAKGREEAESTNRQLLDEWKTAFDSASQFAASEAERLRARPLTPDSQATELMGCPAKMSELLGTSDVLLISTDLAPSGPQDVSARLDLGGVQVFVVLWCESVASVCQQKQDLWSVALSSAGAAEVVFLDPSEELVDVL